MVFTRTVLKRSTEQDDAQDGGRNPGIRVDGRSHRLQHDAISGGVENGGAGSPRRRSERGQPSADQSIADGSGSLRSDFAGAGGPACGGHRRSNQSGCGANRQRRVGGLAASQGRPTAAELAHATGSRLQCRSSLDRGSAGRAIAEAVGAGIAAVAAGRDGKQRSGGGHSSPAPRRSSWARPGRWRRGADVHRLESVLPEHEHPVTGSVSGAQKGIVPFLGPGTVRSIVATKIGTVPQVREGGCPGSQETQPARQAGHRAEELTGNYRHRQQLRLTDGGNVGKLG